MNTKNLLAVSFAAAALFSQVSAHTWSVTLTPETGPRTGYGYSDDGGKVNRITSTFNTQTQRLTYTVNMGKSDANSLPDGFWLALNDGPNPKGIAGELALFYFDNTKSGGPILTAYGYNGFNGDSSFRDGSPAAGTQTPDRIRSSITDRSWINSLTSKDEANGTRTFSFDINASVINNRTPLYGNSQTWEGAQFRDKVGIWFHQVDGLHTSYDSAGYLTNWSWGKQGWVDGENLKAVPEPFTMSVLGLGLAAMARRRARKSA